MMTHSGGKPCACNQCDKAFIQSGNLSWHMNSHSVEKPYQSDHYNKAYINESDILLCEESY